MQRALYQILCWENTEWSISDPVCDWETWVSMCRNNCEFSCLTNVTYHTQPCISSADHHVTGYSVTALVTFVCQCQPLCSPGWLCPWEPRSQAAVKTSKSTECEGHMLFLPGLQTQGSFFTLWGFHWLFFVITALVIASFCFQTLCKLWPFLLCPVGYEEVNSHFLFTCYDNFNLYCQTITLFFTLCSLIHKLKIISNYSFKISLEHNFPPDTAISQLNYSLYCWRRKVGGFIVFHSGVGKYQAQFW